VVSLARQQAGLGTSAGNAGGSLKILKISAVVQFTSLPIVPLILLLNYRKFPGPFSHPLVDWPGFFIFWPKILRRVGLPADSPRLASLFGGRHTGIVSGNKKPA
jgi:hypothetical protein